MCKCNLSPREDVDDINDRNLHHQLLKEGKCKAVKMQIYPVDCDKVGFAVDFLSLI